MSSYSKVEQLALYINAYNAFTITAVGYWPVDSIRDIRMFGKKKYELAHNHVSLDEIEHKFAIRLVIPSTFCIELCICRLPRIAF